LLCIAVSRGATCCARRRPAEYRAGGPQ
jgi:hypothetical protein